MSDTPRTDHQAFTGIAVQGSNAPTSHVTSVVLADFSRQLERELNAANSTIARLTEGLQSIRTDCALLTRTTPPVPQEELDDQIHDRLRRMTP